MAILHGGRDHFWFAHRNHMIERTLGSALPGTPEPKLLELGCGSGIITNYFIHRGYDVAASDVEPGFRDFLPEKTRTFMFDLARDPIPAEQMGAYDAVILGDVLEHILDPVRTLARIRGFIKKDGVVLVSVPAMQWLWSNLDDISNHVKRYDKATLWSEIKSAGYRVEKTVYYMIVPSLVLYVQRKLILKRESKMLNQDSLHIPRLLNQTMMLVMWMEGLLFCYMTAPFGSSLIGVGRNS